MNNILLKRKEMLKKRSEMLKEMDIQSTLDSLKPQKRPRKKREPIVVDESKRRKSRRIQGLKPEISLQEADVSLQVFEEPQKIERIKTNRNFSEIYDKMDLSGINIPIRVDGSYHGWVNPEVCKKHNIPLQENAPSTTNTEGSITDSHDASKEDNKKTIKKSKGKPSSAKEISRRCLHSNPNSYFYRHVEPNETQWGGDWTEEEIRIFCLTAQQFGCGDKWGLFSSYIPHRVGYQCSNFYRQYILPKGLIIDPHYTITSRGEAIFKHK